MDLLHVHQRQPHPPSGAPSQREAQILFNHCAAAIVWLALGAAVTAT